MKKILIATTALATLGALYAYIQTVGSEGALKERFPDVDPDLVVKFHREMLKEILTGKYPNAETDADYDAIILDKLAKHNR